MVDGPRALCADEWDQLSNVVDTVFRSHEHRTGSRGIMFSQYPQLFHEANRENLRVVGADGKVVCHVGMIEREASLLGCSVQVACIGGVATLPDYRQRGYATAAFADAVRKARADGVDVMLISGGRGMYRRVGCRPVGQDREFTMTPAVAPRLQAYASEIRVAAAGPGDIDVMQALYAGEPVRFMRPREDWEMAFACRWVMNRPTEFLLIYRGADPVAYVLLQPPSERRPEEAGRWRIAEFAGDRTALACALGQVAAERQVPMTIHVLGTDGPLAALLASAGLTAMPVPSSGTLLVINFAQLMERTRPLLAERIGTKMAAQLSCRSDGDRFAITHGGEEVTITGLGDLALYLFGSHDPAKVVQPDGSSDLAATLARALPLPALWYGISYV